MGRPKSLGEKFQNHAEECRVIADTMTKDSSTKKFLEWCAEEFERRSVGLMGEPYVYEKAERQSSSQKSDASKKSDGSQGSDAGVTQPLASVPHDRPAEEV